MIVAVIPARWASTRLEGKVLLDIGGRPMIEHVWERATRARGVDRVLVATDDERVRAVVEGFGGEVRMTAADHPSGTDRIREAVHGLGADVVVNVQGDEPMLDPRQVEEAVAALDVEGAGVGTLAFPLASRRDADDPHLVKVVVDRRGRALYFSRAPIPHPRTEGIEGGGALGHVGLYAFRAEALERFGELPPGPLERTEGLEQLRFLENGIGIGVALTEHRAIGVDTADDLERVRALVSGDA